MSERIGSIVIEAVEPDLEAGRYAVKRVVGEMLTVEADIFKEGHDVLVAVLRWRHVAPASLADAEWNELPMRPIGNDRFAAEFPLRRIGRYAFTIEAWPDAFWTWVSELERKLQAGQTVSSELIEGAALLRQAAQRAPAQSPDALRLLAAEKTLLREGTESAVSAALDPALREAASKYPDRSIATRYPRELPVYADRPRAVFGAWYEFFPRSTGRAGKHGTFADAETFLPYIESLGFDIIYLPPIHPIGRSARKGPNNVQSSRPEDPGSPWAIGSPEGGHKSVHPALGTLADFARFQDALVDISVVPSFELLWLVLGQTSLHGKVGLGQVERLFEFEWFGHSLERLDIPIFACIAVRLSRYTARNIERQSNHVCYNERQIGVSRRGRATFPGLRESYP